MLFLDLIEGPELDHIRQLADSLKSHFTSSGIASLDSRFTPHVTIAKLSKLKSHHVKRGKGRRWKETLKDGRTGDEIVLEGSGSATASIINELGKASKSHERGRILRSIPEVAYQEHREIEGGTVVVKEIQLCQMMDRKDGEYYNVVKRIELCQ